MLLVGTALVAAPLACTEAADPYVVGPASPAADAGSASEEGTSPARDAAVAKKDGTTPTGGGSVVINEISGEGEWVELYNPGAKDFNVGGYKVADGTKDAGAPKLAEAFVFPVGTVVPADGYVIVAGNAPKDGGAAPCPSGVADCFSASWGISNTDGDRMHLLTAGDAIVDEASYPAGVVAKGKSWSRSPNGSGEFVAADPSPGTANP